MDELTPLETARAITETPGVENLSQPMQVALFMGAMVLVAAAMVCLTSFTRIVIVLSFVRRALGSPEIPPNPVLIGLSMFLTLFVMHPTLERINDEAIAPYVKEDSKMTADEALVAGSNVLKAFMLENARVSDVETFMNLSGTIIPDDIEFEPDSFSYSEEQIEAINRQRYHDAIPMKVVIPAFVISELKTAFIMGFCIYIPFLLIDLVVATLLMSLGMMMMPPQIVSTPCKIMLFILVDGWRLICEALASSFM